MLPPMPLVVRANLLLSGLFGIRLEGLKDNNGHEITVQTSVPLNVSVPAFPFSQVPSFGRGFPPEFFSPFGFGGTPPPFYPKKGKPIPFTPFPDLNRWDHQRCFGKCKVNNPQGGWTSVTPGGGGSTTGGPQVEKSSTPHIVFDLPESTTPTNLGKSCGPGHCSSLEICVSWQKLGNVRRRQSHTMVHECLPNDGNHWNKMNPTGGKLCEPGKTYSILSDDQPCLSQDPPCDLHWKYTCVDESESPHSCALRKCPPSTGCVEQIRCGLEPPCVMQTVCLPSLQVPSKPDSGNGEKLTSGYE